MAHFCLKQRIFLPEHASLELQLRKPTPSTQWWESDTEDQPGQQPLSSPAHIQTSLHILSILPSKCLSAHSLFSRFTHLTVPQSTRLCLVTEGDGCTQHFPHFCFYLSRTHQSLSAEAGLSGGLTAPPLKGLPASLRTKTNSLPWPTKL